MRRRTLAAGLLALFLLALASAGVLASASASAAEPGSEDPTRPPASLAARGDAGGGPPLRLTGTWIGPSRRIAVIDGMAFEEGDRVGGHEIVAIEQMTVRLRTAGGAVELRLFGPQESRP